MSLLDGVISESTGLVQPGARREGPPAMLRHTPALPVLTRDCCSPSPEGRHKEA